LKNTVKSFDTKKLARMLGKEPGAQNNISAGEPGNVVQARLDAYVYQRLFLPIATDTPISLKGLDFARITRETLEDLADALYNCDIFDLLRLGNAFASMRPAVSEKQMFI
jgi:hypothetical protein